MLQKGEKEMKFFTFDQSMDYRCDQATVYLETLIEAFPYSTELWIELLTTTDQPPAISEVRNPSIRSSSAIHYFRFSIERENPLEYTTNWFTHW